MSSTSPLVKAGPVRQNRRRVLSSAALAAVALSAACLLGGCTTGEVAARAAASQIGKPYVYGGASPRAGFDCSGLTMWAWGRAGKRIPRTAAAQYAASYPVPRKKLQLGDLALLPRGLRVFPTSPCTSGTRCWCRPTSRAIPWTECVWAGGETTSPVIAGCADRVSRPSRARGSLRQARRRPCGHSIAGTPVTL